MPDTRGVLLLNDVALQALPELISVSEAAHVIVAGRSLVRMTLAELALPGAQVIWTDFRQSASLCALHSAVQEAGGLDRMILSADGERGEDMFALMCAILALLPAMRRTEGACVRLIIGAGAGVSSLEQFVARIAPKLRAEGIAVTLQILTQRLEPASA